MNPKYLRVSKSDFLFSHDIWLNGIERSVRWSGSAQRVTSADFVRSQNRAIRESWRATGDYIRLAMFELSELTGVYPDELKDDFKCREMMKNVNVES